MFTEILPFFLFTTIRRIFSLSFFTVQPDPTEVFIILLNSFTQLFDCAINRHSTAYIYPQKSVEFQPIEAKVCSLVQSYEEYDFSNSLDALVSLE